MFRGHKGGKLGAYLLEKNPSPVIYWHLLTSIIIVIFLTQPFDRSSREAGGGPRRKQLLFSNLLDYEKKDPLQMGKDYC